MKKAFDFCVASINSTPTAGISIQNNVMEINVNSDDLPFSADEVDEAVGFTIDPDSRKKGCASGLGVNVLVN